MNFEEYDNFISNHKYDMLHFIIYYNFKCNSAIKNLEKDDVINLIKFVYNAYLNDETHLDLATICDEAIKNSNNILSNKIFTDEFLDMCYSQY